MSDLEAVWQAATDELHDEIVSPQQKAYLRLTRLRAIVEDTALLSVPNAQVREIIEQRLRPAITEALSRVLGRSLQVVATVRPAEESPAPPPPVQPPLMVAPSTGYPQMVEDENALFAVPTPRAGRNAVRTRRDAPRAGPPPGRPRARVIPASRGSAQPRTALAQPGGTRGEQAEPQIPLRDVRHWFVQPVRPRGGGRRGGVAGQGLQPALYLRRLGTGQDPSSARDRALRPRARARADRALRVDRGVHQRLHQLVA
jgi:chromosomal replication initiator protein